MQMTAYNGAHQDLFRAAILESGSPSDTLPTPPANWTAYQEAWNAVVAGIGYVFCLSMQEVADLS